MKTLLKKGDKFTLKRGMNVYASLPARFVFENRPWSITLAEGVINVGSLRVRGVVDLRRLSERIADTVMAATGYCPNPDGPVHTFLQEIFEQHGNSGPSKFDTGQLAGEYVVTCAHQEGGGTQCDMDGTRARWPSGHHVFAERVTPSTAPFVPDKIHFYQTGCFTAMIRPEEL